MFMYASSRGLDNATLYGTLASMSTSETPSTADATRKAAMNGLAIVGFGALIIAGIFLAIYAARYVPQTLSRLSGAVILSSDTGTTTSETDTTDETPTNTVDTPNDTSNTPEEKPKTPSTPTTPPTVKPPVTGGPLIVPQYPRVISNQPSLYGRADLAIINAEIGYMRGSTFVEDNEAPSNRDVAVRFTVKNNGTNAAGNWDVRVRVEGERAVTGSGGYLMPGGTQNFNVRVENPEEGENLTVQIDVDYQDDLDESNERNNDEKLDIDVDN